MADQIQYKCPCCGGAIGFDSSLQKLKCPYCETEFEIETLQQYDEALNNTAEDSMEWESSGNEWDDADGICVFRCDSCGGQILGDSDTAATSCPYCGNPVVITGRLSGSLKPDYVIPFKLDKKAAMAAFRAHLTGKRLLPKVFSTENRLEEIKGIYVPFWLFDGDADAHILYKGTRVRTWEDLNAVYTETSYYAVTRSGTLGFDHIPADGSSKMADDLMESLEPYDFSEAVDFKTAYLAGYLADKYDVTSADLEPRINQRVKTSTESAVTSTVQGYASLSMEQSAVRLMKSRVNYVLYPVWLMTTRWKGELYRFAMNGQTGKFVGDLPVDGAACSKWRLILFAISAAAVYALSMLMH